MPGSKILTPELPVEAFVEDYRQRDNLRAADGSLFWLESEPLTGLSILMRWRAGCLKRLTPAGFSVRSHVNGYGGGAFCVLDQKIYLVNAMTQQVHVLDPDSGALEAVTSEPDSRFGGLVADPHHGCILAVREHMAHGRGVGQTLAAIDLHTFEITRLAGAEHGNVNIGCPSISDGGGSIAWIEWTLPAMPWEQTTLKRAELGVDGSVICVQECPLRQAAAIQQPCFKGESLYAVADHAGWWQPYEVKDSVWTALSADPVDHACAPWQLDERQQAWLERDLWIRVQYQQGQGALLVSSEQGETLDQLAQNYTDFRSVLVMQHKVYVIGRRPDRLDSILEIEPETGAVCVVAGGERSAACSVAAAPESFRFQARDGLEVHGFLYLPVMAGTALPPVVMRVHGGPTSAAYPVFDPQTAFWLAHGFAVADTNYRGSTGYGRAFRMALQGQWGLADHEDIHDALTALSNRGLVDGKKAFIMGRSAGGLTALNALMNTGMFLGCASLFGVTDPQSLRNMTHRFESGYLDWLLGDPLDYPTVWKQRTPLLNAGSIHSPVIFFQGGQDAVVVPEQTETMARILRQSGVEVEVLRFADEGHGFRRAKNQAAMLQNLLRFFRQQLC